MACFHLWDLFAFIILLVVLGGLWQIITIWWPANLDARIAATIRIIIGVIFAVIVLVLFYDLLACLIGSTPRRPLLNR